MKLHELADVSGATKRRKRVGRGPGSGLGKTGGRGMKGQNSRSGVAVKGFEGGQMPIYRRLPKRGFNSVNPKQYAVVNIGQLQNAIDRGVIDGSATIDEAALIAGGVVRRPKSDGLRVLAKGELKTAITVNAAGASKSAVEAIEKAGGSITLADKTLAEQREMREGVAGAAPVAVAAAAAAAGSFEATADNRPAMLLDSASDGDADDLKLISGVGPKLEGLLNEAGVYYFRQVAALQPADIEWLDARLSFKGRIERDGWVEQAKKLDSDS